MSIGCDCEDCRRVLETAVPLERLEAILQQVEKTCIPTAQCPGKSTTEALDQIRTFLGLDKPKQRLDKNWKWHKDEQGDWWAVFGETTGSELATKSTKLRVTKSPSAGKPPMLLIQVGFGSKVQIEIPVETIRGVLRHYGEGTC